MKVTNVKQFGPGPDNPRNSEGAFLRIKNGEILFAYSRYHGESNHDHATCDIWLTRSSDEGETWAEPVELVSAEVFDIDNIMSVSAVYQQDGGYGFYYLSKEKDLATQICRSVTYDGVNFVSERCVCNYERGYYVINNDRIVRLENGQLVAPCACYTLEEIRNYDNVRPNAKVSAMLSDDDGKTWYKADFLLTLPCKAGGGRGLQEPGLIIRENDMYMFMRTGVGCQYQSISTEGVKGFKTVEPSDFTAPNSPMQIKEFDGVMYSVYNPIPNYNGRVVAEGTVGRTPMVIRKSTDGGKTWGPLNLIANEPERGYSYPAIFKTNDNNLLIGMCMGNATDGNNLCRLGIFKIDIDTID